MNNIRYNTYWIVCVSDTLKLKGRECVTSKVRTALHKYIVTFISFLEEKWGSKPITY